MIAYDDRAGRTWWKPLVGLLISISAAAACGMLSLEYVKTRTLNLRDQTTQYSGAIEKLLAAQKVEPANIERALPEERRTEHASWYFYRFTAKDVAEADAERIAVVVRDYFSALNVNVREMPRQPKLRELLLDLNTYEFASLRIRIARDDYSSVCGEIANAIVDQFLARGIAIDEITRQSEPKENDMTRWTCTRISAPAPANAGAVDFAAQLQQSLSNYDVRVNAKIGVNGFIPLAVTYRNVLCAEIELARPEGWDEEPPIAGNGRLVLPESLPLDSAGMDDLELSIEAPEIGLEKKKEPRVAILVDDGGYGGPTTEAILAMDPRLTLAIMPGGTHAAETARRAKEAGFEVILHLPMEHELGPEWLNINMSLEQIRQKTEDAISRVPGIVGINSHMGSLFTADKGAVDKFISVIKDKPYYFIDSRTTAKSVILDAARAAGIKAAMRNVFIDNESNAPYMHKQFNEVMSIAKKRGQAIAICHFRKNTATILPELLPLLEQNGIRLVHASELVH